MYRAHSRDVHRFVLFLPGDQSLADDIVSETFIRLWNARAVRRVELDEQVALTALAPQS